MQRTTNNEHPAILLLLTLSIWEGFSLNKVWLLQSDCVSPSFSNPFHLFIFARQRWSFFFFTYNYTCMYIRFDRSAVVSCENWIDRLFPFHIALFRAKIDLTNNILAIYLSCTGNRWGVYFNFDSDRLQSVENACNCFILRCNLIRCSHASKLTWLYYLKYFDECGIDQQWWMVWNAKEVKSFWHSVFRKVWGKRSFHLLGMSFGNGEWTFNKTHKRYLIHFYTNTNTNTRQKQNKNKEISR